MEANPFTQSRINLRFASTRWEIVRACAGSDQAAQAARETISSVYWYPLYAYIKRKGHQGHDAEDLAQGFFHYIFSKPWFARADPNKGRFRSFLLTSLDNFLHLIFKRKIALKRGGRYEHIPLDMAVAKSRYRQNFATGSSPPESYEIEWASAIVAFSIQRLEKEYSDQAKRELYQHLRKYLTSVGGAFDYEATAQLLGISAMSVKVAVHHLRKRYGAILRDEVARTVKNPADVADEIRHVRAVLTAI